MKELTVIAMNGTMLVPDVDAGRYCLRCGEAVHGKADKQPHLCADIVSRARHAEVAERDRTWAAYARELVVLGGEG